MKKILIVDDEMDLRLMLEKRFIAEGYSVVIACNGKTALVLARSKPPDLIVLDCVLGDTSGEEVAAQLRQYPETKHIPIIFLSALFSKEDEVEKDHALNNSAVFAKPFDVNELLTAVEKLIKEKEEILVS